MNFRQRIIDFFKPPTAIDESAIPKEFWEDHELDVDAIMSNDPDRPHTKPIKKDRQKPDTK